MGRGNPPPTDNMSDPREDDRIASKVAHACLHGQTPNQWISALKAADLDQLKLALAQVNGNPSPFLSKERRETAVNRIQFEITRREQRLQQGKPNKRDK